MKDNDVKGGRRVVWSPQERQAEFMQRGEYEALYGGAAGGGKSDALLAEALRQADKACYRGIIFRKTYPQLTELEDRSQTLYKGAYPAARYNKTKHCWSFPSGAKIYFGAMQHKKDRLNYQGKHYDFVGFDELTQFPLMSIVICFRETGLAEKARGCISEPRRIRADRVIRG